MNCLLTDRCFVGLSITGLSFCGKLVCGFWIVDYWRIILKIVRKRKLQFFNRFEIGLWDFQLGESQKFCTGQQTIQFLTTLASIACELCITANRRNMAPLWTEPNLLLSNKLPICWIVYYWITILRESRIVDCGLLFNNLWIFFMLKSKTRGPGT